MELLSQYVLLDLCLLAPSSIFYFEMPRREETPSEDDDAQSSSQLLSDDEVPAAQWVDENDLDGMVDSEEDEFAEDRENAMDEVGCPH